MTNIDEDFKNMIDSYEEEKAKADSKNQSKELPHDNKVVQVKFEVENFAVNQYGKPKTKSIKPKATKITVIIQFILGSNYNF